MATLLDGEGGDEVLGCAPYLIADRLRRGRLRAATRLARSLPGMGPAPDPRMVRRALVRFGLRGALPHTLHRALRRWPTRPGGTPAWLAADLAAQHRADEDPWAWKRLRAPRWWAGKAHDLFAGSEELGAADQLRREAASAGLRFAHPYRDQELIELALALPPEPAFDAELDRPLARQAMRGTLPDEVRRGTAKPFFNRFLAEALQADLPAIRRLVGSPDAAIRSFVDAEAVISVLDAPASRRRLEWPLDVWRLATLEFWLRTEADAGAMDVLVERAAVPV